MVSRAPTHALSVRLDIYGNALDWRPTGRRRVDGRGSMRAEMVKDDARSWMGCRPHEDCVECSAHRDHDGCPVLRVGTPREGV